MIITIDGPIATGKSTIAKQLAREIGFIYFDTGAMYRSFTYHILKNNISIDDTDKIINKLNQFDFDIKIKHGKRKYFVNGEEVTEVIRGDEVTKNTSAISAIKPVREKLVELQKELAKGINVVFEGRDMGTVVFPEAELKIFLTGETAIRAKRRFEENKAKYPELYKELTLEKTIEEINKRDELDTTRAISPLKKAVDAHAIDTSHLSIDEIVEKILELQESL